MVEELSKRCFFACPLDGTIVIECLGEAVDFSFGLSDDGRCGFGGGAIVTRHGNARGKRNKV